MLQLKLLGCCSSSAWACVPVGAGMTRRLAAQAVHKHSWCLPAGLVLQVQQQLQLSHHPTAMLSSARVPSPHLRAWYCRVCRNCGSSSLGAGGLLRLATSSASFTCSWAAIPARNQHAQSQDPWGTEPNKAATAPKLLRTLLPSTHTSCCSTDPTRLLQEAVVAEEGALVKGGPAHKRCAVALAAAPRRLLVRCSGSGVHV